MHRTSWTEAHDRVVAAAAPDVPEPSAAELERIWLRVDTMPAAPRRRRRGLRIGIAVGVAVAVLGTSGLATAQLYTARTGHGPRDAEDLRLGGPGEILALAAPDFGEVIAEETTDIPFPSDADRAFAVQQQVDDARGAATDEFVSTGAVRAWVASAAVCAWSNQWAVGTRTGDETARTEAIGMIRAAPGWPAIQALDPSPYRSRETQQVQDEQGVVTTEHYWDESQFYYLAALGDAVEQRRIDPVALLLAEHNGYCRGGLVPDLPRADPMVRWR